MLRYSLLCGRFLGLLGLLLFSTAAQSDERILAYHADVLVQADGSLLVTETIRVRAEGNAIRRGIYREFPTRYRDRQGNRYRVGFTLLDVRRNGEAEPHHTEQRSNGIVVYAGAGNQYLDSGEHRYEISYQTTRQLGFFEDFDEIYWNVTGSDWAFPIDRASARITLPADVDSSALSLDFYTGPWGGGGQAAQVRVLDARSVWFETTGALAPREGLTVVVGFPKGLVEEPGRAQRIRWFFQDNLAALLQLLGLLVIFAWYFWAWSSKGRDPAKGVIIPRYEPPKGLSPAACRYVQDMGFHREAFTAAVVSLGVKGYLTIEEKDDEFTLFGAGAEDALQKSPPQAGSREPMSPGEQAVLNALLPGGGGTITLDNDEHKAFGTARSGLLKALKSEYKGRLFRLNGWYAVPPLVLTLLVFFASIALQQQNMLIWFAWALAVIVLHWVFIILLRAPTVPGRQVMDEIEGFKLYLGTAEKDRLNRMQSPTMTPELFERFLPYAFALGVENRWTRRFQSEIPRREREAANYQPAWYHGDLGRASSLNHIGSKLNSQLSSAISSAATPPGSSSGGGGGGFSGGGGGGGGGGGW